MSPTGKYDNKGRYARNPAIEVHQGGVSCNFIKGCPVLVDDNNAPIISGSISSALPSTNGDNNQHAANSQTGTPTPRSTDDTSCAVLGDFDGQGRYSCNLAHQYPNGQSCKAIDGRPLLVDASGHAFTMSTGSSAASIKDDNIVPNVDPANNEGNTGVNGGSGDHRGSGGMPPDMALVTNNGVVLKTSLALAAAALTALISKRFEFL